MLLLGLDQFSNAGWKLIRGDNMVDNHREELKKIRTFPSLIKYLRDDMGWPIESDDFEELTFEYTPEELGIDEKNSAKIESIKRLRPLVPHQPWGIFFVKFEPKKLPVVALRRILSKVVVKKRASSYQAEQVAWSANDLLFVSNYGETNERSISFAHFSLSGVSTDLPRLKVLGWDSKDTPLHLDDVVEKLTVNLSWPSDDEDVESWRSSWRSAFTVKHREVITTAQRLSIRLAELAQSVRDRIKSALEIESEDGPLTKLMGDFQKALIQDLDKYSFADMYAQTIAYGLLSVRIADPKSTTAEDLTKHIHTSPFLNELMTSFLKAGGLKGEGGRSSIDFDELGVSEVIDLLDDAIMEAILRDFGDRNPKEDPVIHFYESFLSHYDAESRMKRGVFYTPKPVVSFIVRSVDELLKTEFSLEDGLADVTTWAEMVDRYPDMEIPEGINENQPFVQILDPATGTGTFLVEVIDLIHKNMVSKWSAQGHDVEKIRELWNVYVPEYLLPRLHGFELLMAPYAIAHLKVGLKLYETGYRFEEKERVRIYLTNALEPGETKKQMQFDLLPALAQEFIGVNSIKCKGYFTIVLGNPPYSGHSANKGPWIEELLKDYKQEPSGGKLQEKNPKWLNDDYVKFLRYGQYFINRNNEGILAFINNHSFLDNPTFRGMRWHLLSTFNKINIIDLHGNIKKKEACPDGSPDENVFDIQQGVSINVFIKRKIRTKTGKIGTVFHHDLYGVREYKYNYLLNNKLVDIDFSVVKQEEPLFFFTLKDFQIKDEYEKGFGINDLFLISSVGIVTARDKFTISENREELISRIEEFISIDNEEARERFSLGKDVRDWKVEYAREDLTKDGVDYKKITKITYRPFDNRFTYYTGRSRGFHCMPRGNVMNHLFKKDNIGLVFKRGDIEEKAPPVFLVDTISESRSWSRPGMQGIEYVSPIYLYEEENTILNEIGQPNRKPNLNMEIVNIIGVNISLRFTPEKQEIKNNFAPIDILDYIYAFLHSPSYREKYKEFLKIDFPRIPYPKDKDVFWNLVELGGELRQIHLLESPIVEDYITVYPVEGGNRVEKINYEDLKVKINIEQYFDGVPEVAWEFYIGGYQPAKKWLKDRKGRVLDEDDIIHYQKIIKALAETDRIMKEIDEVIGDKI